ncbi:MAG: ribosome maturation factor RimP, partial [Gemmatimonadota bacterium]|nr:ribosome maturation factor RimP [Gemmatimonadota bacterium]
DVERAVEAMGFEVVTTDRGGGRHRPILKIRIDRPGDPGDRSTVTVEDCAAVTRGLRAWLEDRGEDEADWVIEVSSPGVERPLVKARDFARFAGARIRVRGYGPLHEGSKRLEGTLLGLAEDDPEAFRLDVGGQRVVIGLDSVASARLVYAWDQAAKSGTD